MNIDEIRSAYDHARDFLAEGNLTSIERALCESVIGMYETIVESWEVSHGWKAHSDNLHQVLIECCEQNAVMREALQWYGDIQHYMYQMSMVAHPIDYDKGRRAREALAKVGGTP